MRIYPSVRLVVLSFLLVSPINAVPPQRLIIQFENPLTTEQQQALYQKIETTLGRQITVSPHSTNQRWIVSIAPELDATALESAAESLNKIDQIQYAEPDQLLKPLTQ
ncbi:MAG: hypothetical protein QNJ78_13860 [Gammaproteobacteria bacterium]|nr:hypothetical protein [Gammaproteobacteria bacterium]